MGRILTDHYRFGRLLAPPPGTFISHVQRLQGETRLLLQQLLSGACNHSQLAELLELNDQLRRDRQFSVSQFAALNLQRCRSRLAPAKLGAMEFAINHPARD